MFADDTFSAKSDSDLTRLIYTVNEEINKMAIWFRSNKLAVNITKTKYMSFRSKGKKLPANLPDLIFNENEPNSQFDINKVSILERFHNDHKDTDSKAYKLLGIYLDEHLTLDFHVTHLTKKLNRSHLNYCPIILNCLSKANQNKIFKIQKKAL
jgi:Mg2+ and Co2+ transporter CorA